MVTGQVPGSHICWLAYFYMNVDSWDLQCITTSSDINPWGRVKIQYSQVVAGRQQNCNNWRVRERAKCLIPLHVAASVYQGKQ